MSMHSLPPRPRVSVSDWRTSNRQLVKFMYFAMGTDWVRMPAACRTSGTGMLPPFLAGNGILLSTLLPEYLSFLLLCPCPSALPSCYWQNMIIFRSSLLLLTEYGGQPLFPPATDRIWWSSALPSCYWQNMVVFHSSLLPLTEYGGLPLFPLTTDRIS
jgi:hypothetical protein